MRLVYYVVSISLYVSLIQSSVYNNVKNNVLSYLRRSLGVNDNEKQLTHNEIEKNNNEKAVAHLQSVIKNPVILVNNNTMKKGMKKHPKRKFYATYKQEKFDNGKYVKDPVLNLMARRKYSKFSSTDGSSSLDMDDWKDAWRENWIQKKFEAINNTEPRGDIINMVAARPWGVPCGDPDQHDMPWGSCMLPMECEAEFRVYRGDIFCGRSQFVCCALQITTYDMYQGFENSFEDSLVATSSEEKKNRELGSKEHKRKKRRKEKKKRQKERQKRKRKIRRTIRKIVREIRKILSKLFRNGTNTRKKKTKQLKKFVASLKSQYKKDRNAVKKIHINTVKEIDEALQTRLDQIRGVNKEFVANSTFRDIVVNGTINPEIARMLMENYPEIASMIRARRSNKDYDDLNYDVEYGLLYY